jgi:hypothetical protein
MFSVLAQNRTELDSESTKAVAGSGLVEEKEEDGVFLMLNVDRLCWYWKRIYDNWCN